MKLFGEQNRKNNNKKKIKKRNEVDPNSSQVNDKMQLLRLR